MKEDDIIKALAALGQPQRLKIFRALVVAGNAGLTPGVMAEALGIPAATLSFHLKELASAGLVTQERASRNLIYRAAYDRMNELLGYLTENCCQGQECLDPAATRATAEGGRHEAIPCPPACREHQDEHRFLHQDVCLATGASRKRLRQVNAHRPAGDFAISTRGGKPGIDDLGIQTDNAGKPVDIPVKSASSSCC